MAIHERWCERCPTPYSRRCKREGRFVYLCPTCMDETKLGEALDQPLEAMRERRSAEHVRRVAELPPASAAAVEQGEAPRPHVVIDELLRWAEERDDA